MSTMYSIKIAEPASVKLTLTITMTAGDWKDLREQMTGTSWPAARFKDAIVDMIRQSERTFFPTDD